MANKITFGFIAETLPMLSVGCGRRGRYRVAKLIEKYGADSDVGPFRRDLTKDCPQKNDPKYAFGKCAPMFPDLRLMPHN